MTRTVTVVQLAWLLFGCSSNQTSPPTAATTQPVATSSTSLQAHAGPVGTKLLRDADSSSHTYEIGPNQGEGLGKYTVHFDGKAVWPPEGAGCPELVQCCQALVALDDSLALACLLATARDQDCAVAKKTSSEIALEEGYALPASCAQ